MKTVAEHGARALTGLRKFRERKTQKIECKSKKMKMERKVLSKNLKRRQNRAFNAPGGTYASDGVDRRKTAFRRVIESGHYR